MRKILSFTLLLCMLIAVDANAQSRKTWDFTKGLSDATQADLIADATNWTVAYQDDGVSVKEAKDLTKMSGELQANGNVIEELRGIVFGSAGLSKNNNYIVASSKMRVTRKNMEINMPRLAPGQTLTIRARSANGTAKDRGFTAGNENLEYVQGPADGLCLGGSLEDPARDADGNYTLVWKVKDDVEGDSADVKIKVVTGGLDIALIQIDNGDGGDGDATNVAYIYDSGYPDYAFGEDDMNYDVLSNMLPSRIENVKIQPIDVADGASLVTADSLQFYNTVVVSNAIRKDNAFVGTLKSAIAFVPMLNLSPELYETWGYGKSVATETNILDVTENGKNNALFTPADETTPPYIDENGQLKLFDEGNITGYEAGEGSYFANDAVLATAGTTSAIHMHNAGRNAYLMVPYSFPMASPAESFMDIVPNAVTMLVKTKAKVINAATPKAVQDYHHNYTTVSLVCTTKNASIYYTVDGTEPTTASTPYTEPFDINAKGVTVKAIATADGYLTSETGETAIDIYELATAPAVSFTEESGVSTVTITPANEGDVVYYNYTGSDEAALSAVYTEPLAITKHATITAFTAETEGVYLQSEIVQKDITVKDEAVRMDIVSAMDANSTDYNKNTTDKYYTKGYNFYSDEVIEAETEIYPDYYGPGQDSIVYHYVPSNTLTCMNSGKGWEIKTYGQPMLYQSLTVGHNILDFNGYNPQTPEDDSEQEITANCISFGSVSGTDGNGFKDPASACIQSTEAFQGPFDVVTYMSVKNAKVEVLVTNDTISGEWTKLGDLLSNDKSGKGDNGKAGDDRIWKKTVLAYNGSDMMFVKVASAGTNANIFNIFIKNEGEISKNYITGIEDVNNSNEAAGEIVRTMVYSINGTLLDKASKGINIVKDVYANGKVKTKKVVIK